MIEALEDRGVFSRFIFEHLEEDRKRYSDFTENEFYNGFRADDILFERFIDYLESLRFKLDYYVYEDIIKLYLKANLAEQLFSPNLHAKIKGQGDPMLEEVLKVDQPKLREVPLPEGPQ